MARQRKSGLDDLVAVAAQLPWWVGGALAFASYAGLHFAATQPMSAPTSGTRVTAGAVQGLWHGLAWAGQYLLPLAFGLGAGVSAYRQHHCKQLHTLANGERGAAAIDGMSWRDFERLVGEGFRQRGFSVAETGGGGADGGVDLTLGKDGERFLVQCKQWRALKVGVTVVRELYGVMAARGAVGGFVVTVTDRPYGARPGSA